MVFVVLVALVALVVSGVQHSDCYLFHLEMCNQRKFPNLGINAFETWNYGFPVLPIGTVIVSQAETIGSELRDSVYFNNCTFPSRRHVLNSDTIFYSKTTVKKGCNMGIRFNIHFRKTCLLFCLMARQKMQYILFSF